MVVLIATSLLAQDNQQLMGGGSIQGIALPASGQPAMPDQGQSIADLAIPAPEPIPSAPVAAPEQPQPTPEPVVTQPTPVQKQENLNFGEGVDTIDVESGGNWLHKRVIWEDAQAKYEKIKNLLTGV